MYNAFLPRVVIKVGIINTLLISKKNCDYIYKILRRETLKEEFSIFKNVQKMKQTMWPFKTPGKTAHMEQKKCIYFLKTINHKISIIIQHSHFKIFKYSEYSKFGNTHTSLCFLPPSQYRQPVTVNSLPLWPSKDQIYIRHTSNLLNCRHR